MLAWQARASVVFGGVWGCLCLPQFVGNLLTAHVSLTCSCSQGISPGILYPCLPVSVQ